MENRFGLIVGRVCNRDERAFVFCRRGFEKLIPRAPSSFFDSNSTILCESLDVGLTKNQADFERLAKTAQPLFVSFRFSAA